MNKIIIFDFDGTLADTLNAIVSITNRLAVEFGYKSATKDELAEIRNLNSWEIIKHSGISVFKVPFLVRKVRKELKNEIQEIRLFPGIKEVLLELKNQGNQLGIITSNSKENVLALMERNDLQEIFDFIYTGTTLFGKDKVINNWLKQANVKREDVIYVGDETRDIDAAKKAHIKMVAVSWGFNVKAALAERKPDFLIEHPQQLIEVIKN
ncbi:MAG TPA: HAD-IA family hydrolase [Kamptonema sp.]|nr:HAD-IA family hydrolase [Kamptonema sp.]